MTRSQRVVPSAHSLHHGPDATPGVTTQSEDPQSQVVVDGVACSRLRPPRYPRRSSRLGQNQHLPEQRSTTRRRRKVSSAGGVVPSGTQNTRVPRQAVVQQGHNDDSGKNPSRPLQRTHARSTCQSDCRAKLTKAESAIETLKRARMHESVKLQRESAARAASELERQRYLEEEFSRRLSVWKGEAELRKMREQEKEKDAHKFARSGVYTREQHQPPRYWAAARVWNNIGGFADLVVARKPLLGVWDRLHLSAMGTSCR